MSQTFSASTVPPLWDTLDLTRSRRCVLAEVFGENDTGKSTLALTAPSPIAYIHTYEKVDFLLEAAVSAGKELRPCAVGGPMRGSTKLNMDEAEKQVKRVEAAVTDAYSWARSIVLDTHSKLWALYQLARLGSLTFDDRTSTDQKKGQLVYAEINARWLSLFQQFRVQARTTNRTNLIMIGRTAEEYKGNVATGRRISHGMKENAGEFDVRLRTKVERKPTTENGKLRFEDVYSATIEKPWAKGSMRGEEVSGPMLDFSVIMSMLTDTDLESWA